MSFICTICLDRLTLNSPSEYLVNESPTIPTTKPDIVDSLSDIIATRCGHLFHVLCLKNWFRSRARIGHDCPYCKANVGTNEYQRIYPVGDDESDISEKTQQRADEATDEIKCLKSEITQLEKILEMMGSQLEEKKMALEISQELLQEKSIECESLQTEKEEQKVIVAAIKKDCRETVENLEEKLKNSLYLFRIASQSSRDKIRSLQDEVDTLRKAVPAKRSVESQTDTLSFSAESIPPSVSSAELLDFCLKYFNSIDLSKCEEAPHGVSEIKAASKLDFSVSKLISDNDQEENGSLCLSSRIRRRSY